MRYNDDFRAGLVAMLRSQGWPEQKGALTRVAQYGGVPATTLRRWALGIQNPPPVETVNEKTFDLANAIREELTAIFGELPSARPDADYRALVTAAGILIDKLQLLSGAATERTEHIVSWRDVVLAARQDYLNGQPDTGDILQ